jgi:hypothetical protein
MAAWQFHTVLVPRASWERAPMPALDAIRGGSEAYWHGLSAREIVAAMSVLGPATPVSWCPGRHMWGAGDGTCVELAMTDRDEIEELRFRIDMRAPQGALVLQTLSLARRLGAVLVTETGAVLEPRLRWFLRAARESRAAAFVDDPRAFLDSSSE